MIFLKRKKELLAKLSKFTDFSAVPSYYFKSLTSNEEPFIQQLKNVLHQNMQKTIDFYAYPPVPFEKVSFKLEVSSI